MNLRRTVLIAMLACLTAAASDAPAPQETAGREAEIRLHNGTVLRCVVLSFADGKFRVDESGRERVIELASIDRVTFGEPVGERVRGPLDPPQYPPGTTAPAAARAEEEAGRSLEQSITTADAVQLMRRLWLRTGRFKDSEKLTDVEREVRELLAATPKGRKPHRNLPLALAILRVAQGDVAAAHGLLAELKKEHPEDSAFQRLTPAKLAVAVQRWREYEPRRGPPRERRPDAQTAPAKAQ